MSQSDFEQRCRGEISAEEYVRRLRERVAAQRVDSFPCLSCRLVGACGGFVRGCPNYYRDEGMRP
jgi:hypothetical protein